MTRIYRNIRNCAFMLLMVAGAFGLDVLLLRFFHTKDSVESVFVLAVFLVSLKTKGYFWGITASLISVLAVNFAFTYPYWAFDLISLECISAAIVMLVVAIVTSALTTKLKQQEKMRSEAETERMRGNLLRAVSHDLRTPLTSIYGACSAMLESYDEIPREKHLKMLKDVQGDAQWLVRMVENLLSVTRVDADSVKLSMRDTVLEELIDTVLIKFRKHYPHQNVILELPEEFVSIPMDAMLIEQVLMNLLENAVLHAENMEHLWLRVVVRGTKAVFYVEDDGRGIVSERMPRLFTDNFTPEPPADNSRSSMGIGLSVCSTIIKAHGGEIRAGSRPGGGAQFRFTLEMEEPYGE